MKIKAYSIRLEQLHGRRRCMLS